MFRYSEEVFREIIDYLSWQNIPFRAGSRVGTIAFSAGSAGGDGVYKHFVNISENAIFLEAVSPVKIPQGEKIWLRLLKFCNEVNRADRMGGVLVLDPDSGKLLCRMTIPFSHHRCGRVDQLLPVPAGMLNYYGGAVQRLIQGTSSVAGEKQKWKGYPQFWDVSPLISPETHDDGKYPAQDCRRRQLQRMDREIAEYMKKKR